jgi:hypothetical protein
VLVNFMVNWTGSQSVQVLGSKSFVSVSVKLFQGKTNFLFIYLFIGGPGV